MGGFGSGRSGAFVTIERTSSIVLSIDRLMAAQRRSPEAGGWAYRYGEGGSLGWLNASLHFDCEAGFGNVQLRYQIDHYSKPTGLRSQTVNLTSRRCPYGGRRWYFLCPLSGRRCSKLYLPNGCTAFYGRIALRLAYQSTRETELDRAHRRLGKLYQRLGGHYTGIDSGWPGRPKGMRRRTFDAFCDRIERGEEALNAAFMEGAARIIARDRSMKGRLL